MFNEAKARELLAVVRLRVKRLRAANSQEDIAARIPADVRAVQRFEAADFSETDPQIRSFMKMAHALGVELHELLAQPSEEELEAIKKIEHNQSPKRTPRIYSLGTVMHVWL